MLDGHQAKNGFVKDDAIYVAANMHWDALDFELPQLSENRKWHLSVNTSMVPPETFYPLNSEPVLENQSGFIVGGRSVIVLIGK